MEFNRTLDIHPDNQDAVLERVAKLNKRAAKLGVPALLTVSFSEVCEKNKQPSVTATLEGEAPSLVGWSFVATLEHDQDRVIIRTIPGLDESLDLSAYRTADPDHCDHCGLSRQRAKTFLVINSAKEIKQVGGSCLKDFLGHPSPLSYFLLAEEIEKIGQNLGKGERRYLTTDLLANAAAVIEQVGYTSASRAYESGQDPTKSVVQDNIFYRERKDPREVLIYSRHHDETTSALEWVRSLDADKIDNDYMHNLYTICSADWIKPSHVGYAVSLFSAYDRAMERVRVDRERREKGEFNPSDFEGQIGERRSFTFEVTQIFSYPTDFGAKHKHILVSTEGNALVWATTSRKLDKGTTYTGTFTVDAHEESKYGRQTKLLRPAKLAALEVA